MADRDASAPAGGRGLATDLFEVHARWIEVEIKMEVDIAVEPARQRKDTLYLPVRIAIGIRTAADEVRSVFASFDQQFLGARVVEQSFLGKDTNLDIDGPGVILLEPTDGVKALEAYSRIDLDMGAHAHRPLQDRLFQRAPCTLVDIVFAERALGGRDFADRFRQRSLL